MKIDNREYAYRCVIGSKSYHTDNHHIGNIYRMISDMCASDYDSQTAMNEYFAGLLEEIGELADGKFSLRKELIATISLARDICMNDSCDVARVMLRNCMADIEWLDRCQEGADASVDKSEIARYAGELVEDEDCLGRLATMIEAVAESQSAGRGEASAEIVHAQELVISVIERLIDMGYSELYVLLALLAASDDWNLCIIVRKGLFRSILLKGVETGCLAPDNKAAWHYLSLAAETNNPSEFMRDIDGFHDLLSCAAADGDENARDIMDLIWEPEQIVEED